MADEIPADETPMQRALRLKKAAQEARPDRGGGRRGEGERAAAARSASKSTPWMKK